jgi:hypothetical protein
MKRLRVLIVENGQVVDVHELEDPRVRYIAEFNQLNQSTQFTAVAVDDSDAVHKCPATHLACRPKMRCRSRQ